MTRNEWLSLAKEWERKAEDARFHGEDGWAMACDEKAWACRKNADLATTDEEYTTR